MRAVFVASDNIFSPIGPNTAENFSRLAVGVSGIERYNDPDFSTEPFFASLFPDRGTFQTGSMDHGPTRFEEILIQSIGEALEKGQIDSSSPDTALIIASTKGNISLLENPEADEALIPRISLHGSADLIAGHFNFINPPLVVSNACISGLLAIITGSRLIRSGLYENVVIAGADIISKFILSGFQSFQALSAEPCKPFDARRKGINLGEGAATLVLSSDKRKSKGRVRICGGAVSNDANHISGPSRTGEELCMAMNKAMNEAGISTRDVNFISAHGTATGFNDEMEARAITMAKLESVPVNSLKGYYGHTLGAAGLIESIVSIHSLEEGLILPTMGFNEPGTSKIVNVCRQLQTGPLQTCLKTASGFGGCNAAIVLSNR
jgi:3-oxoacyl-[acyl-carrier-protein] synthase I